MQSINRTSTLTDLAVFKSIDMKLSTDRQRGLTTHIEFVRHVYILAPALSHVRRSQSQDSYYCSSQILRLHGYADFNVPMDDGAIVSLMNPRDCRICASSWREQYSNVEVHESLGIIYRDADPDFGFLGPCLVASESHSHPQSLSIFWSFQRHPSIPLNK